MKEILNLFKNNFNKTFYLTTNLTKKGKEFAIQDYYNPIKGNKTITFNNQEYKVSLPDWKTWNKKYPNTVFYTNRFISFDDFLSFFQEYTHIDKYNILLPNQTLILNPFEDHKLRKPNCVYTLCIFHNKTFEIADVIYDNDFTLTNINIIPLNQFLHKIDFTKEAQGKNSFIYFPELNAISIKISHTTHRKTPKFLQHIQNKDRIWIK